MAVPGKRVQKINTTPVSLLYKFFQARVKVEIWLFENTDVKIQGTIIGFDEYMNLTMDNACEINTKKNKTKELGRILFKGDNVALIRNIDDVKV
mmetsp:Transcript_8613/g.7595  ORF Transcript_8613/g.7595 Transcript_8613/m.7595 type:complete len:94 (+) Transcript_8613:43-324(+)